MAAWRRGQEGVRVGFQRGTKILLELVDISIILIVVMVSKMSTCVRTDYTAHFKPVRFIVYQLYTQIKLEKK